MLESNTFRYCGHFGKPVGGGPLNSQQEAIALYRMDRVSVHLFVVDDIQHLVDVSADAIRHALIEYLKLHGLFDNTSKDSYQLIRNYL